MFKYTLKGSALWLLCGALAACSGDDTLAAGPTALDEAQEGMDDGRQDQAAGAASPTEREGSDATEVRCRAATNPGTMDPDAMAPDAMAPDAMDPDVPPCDEDDLNPQPEPPG